MKHFKIFMTPMDNAFGIVLFAPFILAAVIVGLGSYVAGQIREFRLGLR